MHMAGNTHDELHILPDGIRLVFAPTREVAADRDHPVLSEKAEGPRYDQKRIYIVPTEATAHKCAHIFDHLEAGEPVLGNADFLDFPFVDLASVDGKDVAAQCGSLDAIIQRERGDLK